MADETPRSERDFWAKLEVLLHPLGGMFTALAVTLVGIFGSQMLERRQAAETNARLYSEIMSRREESETALRKDMLVSVVQSYLQPKPDDIANRVLNVELLAYNFSDSINLKPLFVDLARQIKESSNPRASEFRKRLQRVAREIASKQLFTLEPRGASFRRSIDFTELGQTGKGTIGLDPESITIEGQKSEVGLRVLEVNPTEETVRIRLEVKSEQPEKESLLTRAVFDVGFFDYPMIDNTRLAQGQRCSVTLTNFSAKDSHAEIAVVCFPGEFASVKDRPYYDEVIRQLRQAQAP
jgi:hypothetical protein